jgi:periplasmic protein TonB
VRAGVLVSAAAHAAVLALVVRGLPWLRPHDQPPVSVVEVSLVTPADLAAAQAAVAALSRGAVEPLSQEPDPSPVPRTDAEAPQPQPVQPESVTAPTDGELLGDLISLAPAFDPTQPLGLGGSADVAAAAPAAPQPAEADTAPLRTSERPRARPERAADALPRPGARPTDRGAAGSAERAVAAGQSGASTGDLRAGLAAAVHRALAEARVYPKAARDRGITGAATLQITLTRQGQLITARLVAPSGSDILDAASLAAARNARYPAAPDALPGNHFTFDVRVLFTP